jgi:RNase P subunit RPR2
MDEATTSAPAVKVPSAENEGYCVKCKAKRVMNAPTEVEMPGKGGAVRRAMTGTCSVCGTKMFKILGKKV